MNNHPEEAAEKPPQDPEPVSRPDGWHILTDCPVTRRKVYHAVYNPQGEDVFRSRRFWDCVEYLDAQAVERYEIAPGALKGREVVKRLSSKRNL